MTASEEEVKQFFKTTKENWGENWGDLNAREETKERELAEKDFLKFTLAEYVVVEELEYDETIQRPEAIRFYTLDEQVSDAYEKLVDRYLSSPHYGERWARHWLDVVH